MSTPAAAPHPPRIRVRRARILAFLFASACTLTPVLCVRRPPVLDLAPQVDQARLAISLLGADRAGLELRPLAPNRISYPLLALGWLLGGATAGARLGLALCLVATVAAVHWLAASFRRPVGSALIATPFVASGFLYGGFFNFALGSLGFVLWLRELQDPRLARRGAAILVVRAAAIGALLAFGHVLWLGAAACVAAFELAGPRRARRAGALRLLGLAPLLLAGLVWFASAPDPGWSRGAVWRDSPLQRLAHPGRLAHETLGGVHGALEPALLAMVAAWCLAGLRRRGPLPGGGLRRGGRRRLAAVAGLFLAAGLLLPSAFGDTSLFASRWLPWAAIFLTLAAPPPPLGRRWERALAAAILAGFFVATATTWRDFERTELAGLEPALGAVPPGARLALLDFRPRSERMRVAPFAHLGIYAVLERGAVSARSFAEIPSSLVLSSTESGWSPPYRPRLDRLRARRLTGFDVLLVHAAPRGADAFARRFPEFVEVAGGERWRLFRPRAATG